LLVELASARTVARAGLAAARRILGPALGVGHAQVPGSPYGTYWTQDFGGSGAIPKIPSGSHWTAANHFRNPGAGDSNVEFWANWYDLAGGAPASAAVEASSAGLVLLAVLP
jgi:hypothetical protein